ncbi:MAG: SEC59/DGK1/VTE5 family protein [Candidatus Nanoarchaeia archaeon]|nr:SEC59/DGK1/VTE5 family protein [Candidatus Nanoarchaeia archaeon]
MDGKTDWLEIKRQLFHLFLGISIVLLYNFQILSARRMFIILVIGILISIASTRYKVPGIAWFLERFERKHAKFPGQGAIFFVLGCFTVIGLFPPNIASAAILVLAAGDSFSTLIGKHFGKHKMGSKSVEGTIAGIVLGFLGAFIFVPFLTAFLGAFVAMISEALDIKLFNKVIDDNLLVPVVAAIVMYGWSLI